MGRCGYGLIVEAETVLFDFCFDFGTEIVHESAKRVGWPAWKAFVKIADHQLDLIMILADGLGD